ncbi:hypothetical protein ACFFWD_40185 [Bradyrhizobium erythrophlei]|uniref:hypothetical protein n=1 Tax=Bradyrhizobium erythrophlei TaxID=1437360 RepID=UPI0035EE25A8
MQPHQKRSTQDDWRHAEGHCTPKQGVLENIEVAMHGSSFPPASLGQGLRPKRSWAITIVNILGTGDVVAAAGALAGHAC